MAQKIEVTLIDDLDGSPASETVIFSIDGSSYEIDLSTENAAEFREMMRRYVRRGRMVKTRSSSSNKTQATEIRQWAIDNGYDVNERGRIPQEIVDAYRNSVK